MNYQTVNIYINDTENRHHSNHNDYVLSQSFINKIIKDDVSPFQKIHNINDITNLYDDIHDILQYDDDDDDDLPELIPIPENDFIDYDDYIEEVVSKVKPLEENDIIKSINNLILHTKCREII